MELYSRNDRRAGFLVRQSDPDYTADWRRSADDYIIYIRFNVFVIFEPAFFGEAFRAFGAGEESGSRNRAVIGKKKSQGHR